MTGKSLFYQINQWKIGVTLQLLALLQHRYIDQSSHAQIRLQGTEEEKSSLVWMKYYERCLHMLRSDHMELVVMWYAGKDG